MTMTLSFIRRWHVVSQGYVGNALEPMLFGAALNMTPLAILVRHLHALPVLLRPKVWCSREDRIARTKSNLDQITWQIGPPA